jgi:hypothetical protein
MEMEQHLRFGTVCVAKSASVYTELSFGAHWNVDCVIRVGHVCFQLG